ncbi:MAG: DUF3488 and transglutaminase-like domain-containing protein [Propionibacteriaceae bacterium]|nr:DUF3488 and transglutaminase-like domain-containing protein [Propionibacteriaceae bacterium]
MRFSYHPLSSVIVAAAVWLGLLPLAPLVQDLPQVLTRSLFILGTSAVIGFVLALLRAPRAITLLTQLIAILAVLVWRGLALAPEADGAVESLRFLSADGVELIQTGAPPLPMEPGVLWLCLVLAAVLVIVVELLVNGLEQPAWSIAPLALTYGISALIISTDLEWWLLAPVILGYVAVLLSVTGAGEAAGKASRAGSYHLSRSLVGLGGGAAALALALLVALIVPLGDKQPWNDGGADGPIQLSDPTVRLDQDLRRPTDSPVLTYRTSTGEPAYLRTVALPKLTSAGAGLLPMSLNRSGLDRAYPHREGERVDVEIQMAAVPSEYLPAPFAPASWDADGAWSFDPDTLAIVASGDNRTQQTVNLGYRISSNIPEPSREEIQEAQAGSGLNAVTREVPDGLAPEVGTLTRAVVGDAATAGEKALRIQQFLRSAEFNYSLQAPSSSSSDAISNFLLADRSGYCIHFASAMIAMARIEGIDARMAIGFVPGEQQADGTYAVTSHDAHAWPELYLDGLGWVAFEPTPAYSGNPEYVDPSAMQPEASPSPTPEPTTTAVPTPAAPTAQPTPTVQPTAPTEGTEGTDGGPAAGWLLGVLGVLLLLALPALVRLGLRYARLWPGQEAEQAADAAWAEVRALFVDYGLAWPEGSPGPVGQAAAEELPPQGAAALTAISSTVERSRFARDGAAPTELAAQVGALRTALARAAASSTRVKAVFLPASLWRRDQ